MMDASETKRSSGARERILAAATDLAGREGLETLTTRRVAKEARVNVGLLHYYFDSKESLIDETLGLFLEEMLAEAEARWQLGVADSLEDRLTELLVGSLERASGKPGLIFGLLARLLAAVAEAARTGKGMGGGAEGETALPLGAMAKMQASLFEMMRPLLVARLGDTPELVGRRAIQLLTSTFHPALFTPLPGIIFGIDLRDEDMRRDYVRAIVVDALRP